MRVLIAHSRYRWAGGEETTVSNQASALRAAGHTVAEYLVENPKELGATLAAVTVAPFNPLEYRSVRLAIRRFRPDVVHVHNTWFRLSSAVFRAAHAEGVPSIWTIQNYRFACPQGQFIRDGGPCTDCLGRFPWPGVMHGCYRGSAVLSLWRGIEAHLTPIGQVSAVVVPSVFARDLLIRAGLPEERTSVVYNGVPDPGPRSIDVSDSQTLLYVGRLSEEKGLLEFIEDFEDSASTCRLAVFGDGPLRRTIEQRSSDRVVVKGLATRDTIADAMRSSRALIFPSRWFEVCPLVVIEALAAGLPVAATSIGAMPELLEDVDRSLLVSTDGWRPLVKRLEMSPNLTLISTRARKKYEREFTLERHARSLLALYRRVT